MSLTGKIMTLFADKEKSIPIFPRTKVKAISDDNGIGLDAILDGITNKMEGVGMEYAATISPTWIGEAAPYIQEIAVDGILAGDDPITDLIISDDYASAELQLEEWGKIYRIKTAEGKIIVYAKEPTTISLNIQMVVSREKVIEISQGTQYFTVTLPLDWAGDAAPYSQTVALEGILESDRPKVYFKVPEAFEDLESQQSAFTTLYDVETADGSVTFFAKELPEVAFNVTLEVSRI